MPHKITAKIKSIAAIHKKISATKLLKSKKPLPFAVSAATTNVIVMININKLITFKMIPLYFMIPTPQNINSLP